VWCVVVVVSVLFPGANVNGGTVATRANTNVRTNAVELVYVQWSITAKYVRVQIVTEVTIANTDVRAYPRVLDTEHAKMMARARVPLHTQVHVVTVLTKLPVLDMVSVAIMESVNAKMVGCLKDATCATKDGLERIVR